MHDGYKTYANGHAHALQLLSGRHLGLPLPRVHSRQMHGKAHAVKCGSPQHRTAIIGNELPDSTP